MIDLGPSQECAVAYTSVIGTVEARAPSSAAIDARLVEPITYTGSGRLEQTGKLGDEASWPPPPPPPPPPPWPAPSAPPASLVAAPASGSGGSEASSVKPWMRATLSNGMQVAGVHDRS